MSKNNTATGGEKYKSEAWLREQYVERERTQASIAEEIGVAQSTISVWLNKHNVGPDTTHNDLSDEVLARLRDEDWLRAQYRKAGRTQADIADELGVTQYTISRWLRHHRIQTRDVGNSISDRAKEKLKDGDWVRDQYKDNERSVREIATVLHVSAPTVRKWLHRHEITPRAKGRTLSADVRNRLEDKDWLQTEYHEHNRPQQDIADELGVSQSTISTWVNLHGIETRHL